MKYRERHNSVITISRLTPSGHSVGVINVPINVGSSRKFHLMQEDSVTLNFSLPIEKESYQPVYFKVGDFIMDELFGNFYIREEQMPRYNITTGGYDYQLRFDADYWLAENHILMLTTGGGVYEENGVWTVTGNFVRSETTWNLTGRLIDHALMVLRNLKALGMRRLDGLDIMSDYAIVIDETATHAGESKHLAYDGVHIISALTQMANEFECEWWFENNVLHFGKCGGDGEKQFDFLIGDRERGAGNVESMEISRNQNTYANRLYVLGGTKNIPDSYGKRLMLNVTRNDDGSYQDNIRKINPYTMLNDEGTQWEPSVFQLKKIIAQDVNSDDHYFREEVTTGGHSIIRYRTVACKVGNDSVTTFRFKKDTELSYTAFSAGIRFLLPQNKTANLRLEMRLFLEEYDNGGTVTDRIYLSDSPFITTYTFNSVGVDTVAAYVVHRSNFVKEGKVKIKGGKTYKLALEGCAEFDIDVGFAGLNQDYIGVTDDENTCRIEMPAGCSYSARVVWNNTEYPIIFNPFGAVEGEDNSYGFKFVNAPSGFSNYETVELMDFNPLAIPFSYWTEDYDNPSSMLSLGERRLHLPLDFSPDGYVQKDELADEQIVEQLVRAEDIYPRCYLRVMSVETEDRVANTEYSDGTKWAWDWKAFKVTVSQLNGEPFPMKRKYVQEGEKLQALFLSEMDTERAYQEMNLPLPSDTGEKLLAGMTYDIGFEERTNPSDNTYTLIRNKDYGTMLPNDTLCPKVGDLLVLIGWDVRAMEDLNLISTAEDILFDWAVDYLDAIEEGQWTFTCHMMSDWPFILFGDHQYDSEQFIENDGKPFDDSDKRDVYVRLGKNKYGYVPFKTDDAKWLFAQDGQFYVRNTEFYILPTEGARVRVLHDALKGGEKISRVIGYELKLDKPYDSPTYIVGETDAYSRIKQLEKKLNSK